MKCSGLELKLFALFVPSLDLVEAGRNGVYFAEGREQRYGWPHSRNPHVWGIAVDWARR